MTNPKHHAEVRVPSVYEQLFLGVGTGGKWMTEEVACRYRVGRVK